MPLLFGAMGYAQDQVSFSVLEFSQAFEKGESFIKLAKALGMQWFMMADGDKEGRGYIKRAKKYLENGEDIADRAATLVNADIEHEFWHNGYSDFMLNLVLPQTRNQIDTQAAGDDAKKTKSLIDAAIKQAGGKPAFAQALAAEIQQRGADSIPQTIKDIIDRVVQLAGG